MFSSLSHQVNVIRFISLVSEWLSASKRWREGSVGEKGHLLGKYENSSPYPQLLPVVVCVSYSSTGWGEDMVIAGSKFGESPSQGNMEHVHCLFQRNQRTTNAGEDEEGRYTQKAVWQLLLKKKPKSTTTVWSSLITPDRISIFIAPLLTIAKTWNVPSVPLVNEQIKTMWCIFIMEFYSAIKNIICRKMGITRRHCVERNKWDSQR